MMANVNVKKIESRLNEDGSERAVFEIYADDVVVGQATLDDEYLERIDIDAAFRGNGYGTEAVYAICKESPSGDIYAAPDNAGCKKLFQRIGEDASSHEVYGYVDQGYGVYKV